MNLAYRLNSVTHRYKEPVVLDIPQLELESGRIYALLGPNGSGKSTLLQIMALLLRPTTGTVQMLGEVTGGLEHRRQVTLIHQKPVLFSTSVFNNVAFGLRARGLAGPELEERVTKALKLVDLVGFAGRTARQLSGGEGQRVIIARALTLETPILLLDEPMSYLDDSSRPLLFDLLRHRCEEHGTTVIVATHDQPFAESLVHELLFLGRGKIADRQIRGRRAT
ncbi:MAG: ATP-binding cassette domain-containing protein [Proteobacteria bacterium]|jgi:tungstate transport system ATP-binding protein|nr:ATP-binding cassette domain-containing protein [Pseudomonadota bacterium]